MDIGVGLVSLIPGAGILAITAAITLQSEVLYKPLAKDLAAVYLRDTDSYTNRLGQIAAGATVALEFSREFALEFLVEHAQELLTEVGLGALATCIPFAGAVVGASLDFLIAQMMTWRVGTMTTIYFQNGAEWIDDRKSTMRIAKELTGGLHVTFAQFFSGNGRDKSQSRDVRVDLDDIPIKVPKVMEASVHNILLFLKGFADKLPRSVVRESLLAMGLPAGILDSALRAHYA